MEGGKQAAGKPLEAWGARHGGRRGGSGKPLDAGGEAWWEERRQRETAGRRERGMEGGERRQRETAGRRGSKAWREERRQRVNRWMLWRREARRSSEPVLGMDCHMVVYE